MKFIGAIAVVLGLLFVCEMHASDKKNDRQNIILIVADDLGYADLGFMGSSEIKTPYIDNLASSGAVFTQGYVSSAVCSPSRAGFLTGRNQVTFGYDNNLSGAQPGFDPEFGGLPVDVKTIATRLQAADYTTGLLGKWHLGTKPQFHPTNRGFDEFWGFTGGGHDYFASKEDGGGYMAPIECNYKTPQKITYITDDIGDEACDFVVRNKKDPFFLFVSFNAPHTPYQALEEDEELFSHVKNKRRRTYLAMIHRMDVNIGRIMQTLKDEGVDENTMVVFFSDNGGPCSLGAPNNAPLTGQKGILHEGGIRVPFIIHSPKLIEKAAVYNYPVTSLDMAPTFVEIANGTVDATQFDGVSLIPHLTNKVATNPHEVLTWRFTISAAILKDDWKLIRIPDRLPMLYDLNKDISEQNDVALENLEVTKSLLKELGDWDVSLPHPVTLEGYVWKKNQLKLYDREYNITTK